MNLYRTINLVAWAALALMAGSCNLFGVDPGAPADDFTPVSQRPLPSDFQTRRAVAYSGYRTDQSPATQVYPTEAQILEDLNLLGDGGFSLIRLYDSSEHAVRTLKVISDNDLDIKVMLGIWIAGSKAAFEAENLAQINAGIALANQYPDIILAVSVGNEILVDWSGIPVPPADLVEYLGQVRAAVAQPVGTDDNWEPFSLEHEDGSPYDTIKVAASVDFLAIHTYAYWDSNYDLWDWRQLAVDETLRAQAMMDAALEYSKANLRAVRTALAGVGLEVPLVIGETGWQNAGFPARAHPVNQKMYFDRLDAWVYGDAKDTDSPLACFWFEAFNEPWKGGDDNWGLFNVDRLPRYVIKDRAAYTSLVSPDSGLDASDALYYKVLEPRIVTAPSYYVYADTIPSDETLAQSSRETYDWAWNFWENDTTGSATEDATATAPEGSMALKVSPAPLSWGWGMAYVLRDAPEDMSAFASSGHLRFSVKTSYAGALEFGFLTGSAADSQAVDAYVTINPASNTYGYQNDGSWHEVAIPISAIMAEAAPAYGMATSATLNMEAVYNSFVIADRYATTGKASGANITTPIWLDNIRWTQD